MKTFIKYLIALVVVIAVAFALSMAFLYGVWIVAVMTIFYFKETMVGIGLFFLILTAWLVIRFIRRHKVYTLEEGVHNEYSNRT